jgi:hypothetical protein
MPLLKHCVCGERDECGPFSGIFSAFNFRFWYGDISIKNKNTNILYEATLVFCGTV